MTQMKENTKRRLNLIEQALTPQREIGFLVHLVLGDGTTAGTIVMYPGGDTKTFPGKVMAAPPRSGEAKSSLDGAIE